MTETLISIQEHAGIQTVSARELYQKLEIKEQFADWANRNLQDFENGIDYHPFIQQNRGLSGIPEKPLGGRPSTDYLLTIETAKHLCMLSKTEQGKRIRKYFIACEKVAKQAMNDDMPTIPQTYAQALLEAGRLALENEQLKANNDEQQAIIEQQKPKVLFANSVASSKNSMLVGELAKIITQNGYPIGQNRLFTWLRDNGYLAKYGERKNLPNQQYIEQGLFEIKKTTIDNPDGTIRTTSTTKVTGKGAIYFVNKFLNNQNNNYLKVGNDN